MARQNNIVHKPLTSIRAAFHSKARAALEQLALELHLGPYSNEIRTNAGSAFVAGQTTPTGDSLYIQVREPGGSPGTGIVFRSCAGHRDFTGGTSRHVYIAFLDDPRSLARIVAEALPGAIAKNRR
jgi:hypothetical protein